MKQTVLLFLFLACSLLGYSQIGGDNIYEFLNFSPSARITALGDNLITVRDDDVSLAFANPSLLNPTMHQQLSFNHNLHLGGIQHGYASYGQFVQNWNTTFHGGIQYVNYGTFDAATEFGDITGTFKASEYALTLGAGREVYERLSVGANLKFISSQLESYNSLGISGDVAAILHDTASNFTLTLLAKNIGTQLTTYRPDNREAMPFEMQVGLSKRLQYLPFRFSIIYHHLDRWNILYDDPNSREDSFFFGEGEVKNNSSWLDNFSRHFIFNGEFLFGAQENFRLRLGYNHFRRQELSVSSLRSLSGFSVGVGIKIKRFRMEYGQGFYHLAGSMNHFSISTNLREFQR